MEKYKFRYSVSVPIIGTIPIEVWADDIDEAAALACLQDFDIDNLNEIDNMSVGYRASCWTLYNGIMVKRKANMAIIELGETRHAKK